MVSAEYRISRHYIIIQFYIISHFIMGKIIDFSICLTSGMNLNNDSLLFINKMFSEALLT
jgi:hypothetical protein